MPRRPEPADPHLLAVAAYAQALRDRGMSRWQAAQRASRALPRPAAGVVVPERVARTGTTTSNPAPVTVRAAQPPPTVMRRYLVAPRGPDTATLILHDLNRSLTMTTTYAP